MKTIRFTHPDYPLIVKADLEWENNEVVIKKIKFGLPTKASKLEKLLLKYVEIYCFDVLRNNMYNIVVESGEYNKFIAAHKPGGKMYIRKNVITGDHRF